MDVIEEYVVWRGQAEGAIENGTRVQKVLSEPEDGHLDGSLATVFSSMGPMDRDMHPGRGCRYGYFVIWDDMPGIPVGVCGCRIIPASAKG